MTTSLLAASLALMPLLSGCGAASNPELDLAAEEAALRGVDEQFAAAAAAKDIDALITFYAPDAVVLMPNEPAITGVDGVRSMYEQSLPTTSITWSPDQVVVARAGDVAVTRGTYHMTMPMTARPVEDRGKYLTVWKKVNGQWRVAFDAANTDLPAGH